MLWVIRGGRWVVKGSLLWVIRGGRWVIKGSSLLVIRIISHFYEIYRGQVVAMGDRILPSL